MKKHRANPSDYQIIPANSDKKSAEGAAYAASQGEANVILKGILSTSILLRQILKKEYGLRRKGLLSHTAMLSMRTYPKLLGVTDGGMVIKPTFDQKIEIIRISLFSLCCVGGRISIIKINPVCG